MHWADYGSGSKKAKAHFGFDINKGIPYKLRWDIEIFFGWWKRHLIVYHLIARTKYGLMVQILAGLITYLLLAIYCHKHFNERVSIARVRQLRNQIKNELRLTGFTTPELSHAREKPGDGPHAKS